MGKVKESAVLGALSRVMDPDLGRDIVSLGFIKNLRIERNLVRFDVQLTTPACPVKEQLKQQCIDEVKSLGVKNIEVNMTAQVRAAPTHGKQSIPGVRNIIAVASGKGGVGKSTVAMNLALALNQSGARTGLLDCDFYGPSIPSMTNIHGRAQGTADQKIVPHVFEDVKLMSMGFVVERTQALSWRGPMLHKMLGQFLFHVEWGELDYLILDLPPGTGDVQLSLAQITPLSGAVLVTTPQKVALGDVEKGMRMFQEVDIPVLGIIENMSYYRCGNCEKKHRIFGSGGAERMAKEFNIPVLGEIPLDPVIPSQLGQGAPLLSRDPGGQTGMVFRSVAGQVVAQLSKLGGAWAKPGPGAMEV